MASCGYFFASLRQRSCSSQCRYRSVNAVTKMHCCSERKTAFVQPFCSARCSANKSLKQRCFNVFCIVRVTMIECQNAFALMQCCTLCGGQNIGDYEWYKVQTHVLKVRSVHSIHSLSKYKRMATYMQRMRNNNLEIRLLLTPVIILYTNTNMSK